MATRAPRPLRPVGSLLHRCVSTWRLSSHRFAKDRSLRGYCAQRHLVVSASGDPNGFVDTALARRGLVRHVALTAPNFHFALAILSDSDLLAAMPRQFVARYGARHGVVAVDAPLPLRRFRLHIVAPKVALMDAGLAWLVKSLEQAARMPAVHKSGS